MAVRWPRPARMRPRPSEVASSSCCRRCRVGSSMLFLERLLRIFRAGVFAGSRSDGCRAWSALVPVCDFTALGRLANGNCCWRPAGQHSLIFHRSHRRPASCPCPWTSFSRRTSSERRPVDVGATSVHEASHRSLGDSCARKRPELAFRGCSWRLAECRAQVAIALHLCRLIKL